MKVQRVRLPETNRITWLVLDDDFAPVQPILAYLTFLHDLDRSPNTIRAAHITSNSSGNISRIPIFAGQRSISHIWQASSPGYADLILRSFPLSASKPAGPMPPLIRQLGLFIASTRFTLAWERFLRCLCTSSPCRIGDDTNPSCMGSPKQNRSPHELSLSNENDANPRP